MHCMAWGKGLINDWSRASQKNLWTRRFIHFFPRTARTSQTPNRFSEGSCLSLPVLGSQLKCCRVARSAWSNLTCPVPAIRPACASAYPWQVVRSLPYGYCAWRICKCYLDVYDKVIPARQNDGSDSVCQWIDLEGEFLWAVKKAHNYRPQPYSCSDAMHNRKAISRFSACFSKELMLIQLIINQVSPVYSN